MLELGSAWARSLDSSARVLVRRWAWAAVACWMVASGGCQRPSAETPRGASVTAASLLPVTRFHRDFQWRQRVTARWEDGSRTFDAVLTKDGNRLRLLGLDPMGRPGFVFTLQEGTVSVENRTGRPLPFDPRYILLDVQRAFYPWLQPPAQDGWHAGRIAAYYVVEQWTAGQLRQRRFHATPDQPPEVLITYDEYADGLLVPRRVELTQRALNYNLRIETLDQQTFAPQQQH